MKHIFSIILIILQVIFVIAKILGYVAWSWALVLLPLWILLGLWVIVIITIIVLTIFASKCGNISKYIK